MSDQVLQPPVVPAKVISGNIIKWAILLGIGYFAVVYLIPMIFSVATDIIRYCILGASGLMAALILTNKKFWRGMRYLSESAARATLGWAIEMDPWNVMYMQVEDKEKSIKELGGQVVVLKGQYAKLKEELAENERTMKESSSMVQTARARLQSNPDDTDTQLALETASTNFDIAKDYIDSVKPTFNGIEILVKFATKSYDMSGNALINLKNRIKGAKAKYDAISVSYTAMEKARRAFAGDPDLNNDALVAMAKINNEVAIKLGGINEAMRISSQFMNMQDLKNAAKVNSAVDTIKKLDVDKTFSYTDSVKDSTITANISSGNKYLSAIK